jgi:hypothetical protein
MTITSIGLTIFGWLALCGLVLVVSWIITMFRLFKLNSYLKKNDYQKWREITSLGNFGPGLSNPFRAWPYIFKNTKECDEELLRLKDSAKISMRYSFIWFGTFVFSLIVGFIIVFSVSQ